MYKNAIFKRLSPVLIAKLSRVDLKLPAKGLPPRVRAYVQIAKANGSL